MMNNANFFVTPEDVDENFIADYIDNDTVEEFAEICQSLNMTEEQTLGIWFFLIKSANELLKENHEDDDKICHDIHRLMQDKFGKDGERKRQEIIALINRFGGENFMRLMKETGVGYRIEMLNFLINLVVALGEDDALKGDRHDSCGNGENLKAQIDALMKNPAYFKKTHPEHDVCVQKVYSLRKQMFNED